jgi:hypothetical protein
MMPRSAEETQAVRRTIDALREVLGYGPLYKKPAEHSGTWLTPLGEEYEDMIQRGKYAAVNRHAGGQR